MAIRNRKIKKIASKIVSVWPFDKMYMFYMTYIKRPIDGSASYWEQRYTGGGTSGAGSYDHLAEFKAEVINDFVKRNKIKSVIEFGCGDGNQLSLAVYDNYIGFDVSDTALDICRNIFANDMTKEFRNMSSYNGEKAELTMSLDVIYHLIEDTVYENYMERLLNAAEKYVIIYSSNYEGKVIQHERDRKFTDYIDKTKEWELVEFIKNKYPVDGRNKRIIGSKADFYIFKRID